ncbi:MAG: ATP-binding protein [bacterium]
MKKILHGFRQFRLFLVIFLFLIGMVVLVDLVILKSVKTTLLHNASERLTSVVNYKANEINNWIIEREADALVTVRSHNFPKELLYTIDHPGDVKARKSVIEHLAPIKNYYRYYDLQFVSPKGEILISLKLASDTASPESYRIIKEIFAGKKIAFSDFYFCSHCRTTHLDFYSPVFRNIKDTTKPAGLIILRVDPNSYLYPLIQDWPIPSKTSETLIIKEDAGYALYLNELRHRKNTALKLRLPVSNPGLPSAMAIRGKEGTVEGMDYRGQNVLAVIKKIPQTKWFMVGKTDMDEVLEPMVQWKIYTSVASVIMILLIGLTIMMIIFQQRRDHYKSLYEIEVENLEKEKEAARVIRESQEEIRKLNLELEERVKQRTAQLEVSNRELESFSYSVSHDLRAPLRSMDGFSQALIEDYANKIDEKGRQYLQRIRIASQKMATLIDDLLKLSRVARQMLTLETIDLSTVVKTICDEQQSEYPGSSISFRIQPGILVNGDTQLIKIAVNNLIHNAVKFSSKKACQEVEFGVAEIDKQNVIYIRDNGSGFDMKYINKLFDAFQRLHSSEEFPGTGIGLTIVQRIIHRHGGRIWAESEPDKGAVFYFTLPSILI